MALGPFGASCPLFLRNGQILGLSPVRKLQLFEIVIFSTPLQTVAGYYVIHSEPIDFVCVEVLRLSQQLRSCRGGQLPINTVPGQA